MRPPFFVTILFAFLIAGIAGCGSSGASSSGNSADASASGHDGGSPEASAGDSEGGSPEASMPEAATPEASTPEASTEAGVPKGPPITAPDRTWTWIPFPDAFCGNGAATGIGVNLASGSSRVVIYLEGGGACWSDLTCFTLMSASYVTTGYSASDFATESTDPSYLAQAGGFFDRTAASNPFKDDSWVYVPYCTGDLHAGNHVATYASGTVHHVGFANMSAYLARLVPTFAGVQRVILAGSSAGGYGATYDWWQTQQAFGATRVDLLDDSGTWMPPDIAADGMGESTTRAQWNLADTLPPGCTGCATRLDALYGWFASNGASHRGALLSYVQDSTLPSFWAITTAQFTQGLQEDLSTYFAPAVPASPLRSFTANTSGHVLWFDPTLTVSGVTLQQFVTQMVNDDPSWTSVQ
jgi:hypothetical protein